MTYEIPEPVLKLGSELQEEMDTLGAHNPKQNDLMIQFNNMGAAQFFKAVMDYRKEKGNE